MVQGIDSDSRYSVKELASTPSSTKLSPQPIVIVGPPDMNPILRQTPSSAYIMNFLVLAGRAKGSGLFGRATGILSILGIVGKIGLTSRYVCVPD